MAMPQVHIVALCVDLGYGPTIGGELLSLMLLGGRVSRILSGSVADRIGGTLTLLIGSILQCLALLLYLPSDALVSLYLVSLVFGLSQGGIVPSYAIIIREYLPSEVAGEKIGNVLMMTILGMALGGWLSGWIYDLTGSYTIALANGIPTYKMFNGHRGINHPVMNLKTGKGEITSQNHGFAVDKAIAESNKDFEVSHIHLNDQTVAGLRMKNKNCFSVQYHPEAGPGPNDANYLFDEFYQNIRNHSAKKVN